MWDPIFKIRFAGLSKTKRFIEALKILLGANFYGNFPEEKIKLNDALSEKLPAVPVFAG